MKTPEEPSLVLICWRSVEDSQRDRIIFTFGCSDVGSQSHPTVPYSWTCNSIQ